MISSKSKSNYEITDIPGYIIGSLINIIEWDSEILSEYGFKLAKALKEIRDEEEADLKKQAEELDKKLS